MHYPDLIRRFGVELNLPELAPDASGACAVQLDALKVSFFADADTAGEPTFTAVCPLGALDSADVDTQEILLRGNMFSASAGGSAIGMAQQGQVYLSQRFQPHRLSFAVFFTAMERFTNVAEYWRDNLATGEMPVLAH